jgi:hypothetical protein
MVSRRSPVSPVLGSRKVGHSSLRHATFKMTNGCLWMLLALALFSVREVSAGVGAPSGRWGAPSLRTVAQSRKNQPVSSSSISRMPKPLAKIHEDDDDAKSTSLLDARGGEAFQGPSGNLEKTVESIVGIIIDICRTVLPPVYSFTRCTIQFYRSLPTDAIVAQAGLVYCFAGGYYPTLFAALTAAQNCGWQTMVYAIEDLTEEAVIAIEAASRQASNTAQSYRDTVTRKTMIVLAAIDPVKINMAAGALYTTWLGVSAVLEREFAKTITLSLTISGYLQPITRFVLNPPIYMCVPEEFHKWVPIMVGWVCKAVAMSFAWRIQRVLTASTSAIAGGLMFSRAMMRILSKRGFRLFGLIRENDKATPVDEVIGLMVAGLGLYSQIGNGFDFNVPFPLSLVTWPLDWAEKWIQWQITTKK